MNEASKATIASALADLDGGGTVIDFDTGTRMGKEAAEAAILEFIFDNPDKVTPRPELSKAS